MEDGLCWLGLWAGVRRSASESSPYGWSSPQSPSSS
eukprot:CAMPEP_0197560684 /NCGR_PEP_ID=MMETSP1320-20131121/23687_1 /TAXON_ID=91990 /ORGANISM="Bolidomonas sp., Strain RCC2347" /LENGTH=35 /DNA_ID= /DNA_START= /DNA_END= /DNA_ORIENTATION=